MTGDLWLVEAMNAPELMVDLGGPESPAKLAERHERYLNGWERKTSWMFRVIENDDVVGAAGYWPTEWNGDPCYESGWTVLAEFQGRGIATRAVTLVLENARQYGDRRFVHAIPKVSNAASNAVCRKAGFTFAGEFDGEYPPGNPIRESDWVFDLRPDQPA